MITFKVFLRAFFMSVLASVLLSACGSRPEDRESHAKAALEQKYNTEFEIAQVYSQKIGDLYYEVQAFPITNPDMRFTAAIDTKDDNISDNFVERKVCTAIAKSVERSMDGLSGSYYAFACGAGPQPLTDDADISIDEYVALDTLNTFKIEVFVAPEAKSAQAIYHNLCEALSGMESVTADLSFYVVDEEQMKSVKEYFARNDDMYFEYKRMTADYPRADVSFVNGKIETSESVFVAQIADAM